MSNSGQITDRTGGNMINWQEMYILVNHWRSDLNFYKHDIRFLKRLIEKYLIWITKKENLERVSDLRKKENDLDLQADRLCERIKEHQSLLGNYIDGKMDVPEDELVKYHTRLESDMTHFVREFREKRREVFKVTEYIMDSEELQNILHS